MNVRILLAAYALATMVAFTAAAEGDAHGSGAAYTDEFGAQVRAYLLDNPEVVLEVPELTLAPILLRVSGPVSRTLWWTHIYFSESNSFLINH